MAGPDLTQTTLMIRRAVRGDRRAVDGLLPLVYAQLRERADRYLRRERTGHTLQPTALVHEAYLRLADDSQIDWKGRTHFKALAANRMRQVLVDHARRRDAAKRGGGWRRVALSDLLSTNLEGSCDLLDLEQALEELGRLNGRQARIVELRFFSGLTVDEAAHTLGVSSKAVEKDWQMARAWLARRLVPKEPA